LASFPDLEQFGLKSSTPPLAERVVFSSTHHESDLGTSRDCFATIVVMGSGFSN
jgi:hypothetical protein